MDTLSPHALQDNPLPYYVYTLAYPDGTVFYVGKGTNARIGLDRIDEHERDAKNGMRISNPQKVAVIRAIWEKGGEVLKQKVAHFSDETEAYMYEYALINLTCYAEQLVNMVRSPSYPKQPYRPLPQLEHPICFRLRRKFFHRVSDLEEVFGKRSLNRIKMREVIEGKIPSFQGFAIVYNCDCCNAPQ